MEIEKKKKADAEERAEKEKTRKYYEAEKRKMENEKRAKQGLPPLPDPDAVPKVKATPAQD